MIRLLLIILLALLIGTGLSLGLQYDLGYIRISLGHYLIETNLWVGLGLIVALIVLTVLTINLIRRLRTSTGLAGLPEATNAAPGGGPPRGFWHWPKATGPEPENC